MNRNIDLPPCLHHGFVRSTDTQLFFNNVTPHTLGAYFGLVASYLLTPPETSRPDGWDRDNTASYSSDMLAMIGTLFLFLYWPSFSTYTPIRMVGFHTYSRSLNRKYLSTCL